MRTRAEALLAGQPLRSWMSTFHSFCVRLLRREAVAAGLDPRFQIYDETDQLGAVKEAMRALDLSEKLHPPRRLLARISARKSSGQGEEEENGSIAGITAEVEARYRQVLEAAGALDFDDLLLRAVALLGDNIAVCEAWGRRFPLPPRGRVSGHQPLPIRARAAARSPARQPDRRGRRGPVDLFLARRSNLQHSPTSSVTFLERVSSASRRTTARPRRSSMRPRLSSRETCAAKARCFARYRTGASRSASTSRWTSTRRQPGWSKGSPASRIGPGPPSSFG